MKKVLVAMSGGVDSSAALVILKKNYDVIGATLKLHGEEPEQDISACCSLRDIEDARRIAESFGIAHYVYDFKELFEEMVIKRFVQSYERGVTPNPCIDCNTYIKFGALHEKGLALGCDCIATGHYARVEYDEGRGRWLLKKAVCSDGENEKDQSYVLYNLTQEQLSRVIFPLGALDKSEVRSLAAQALLLNAHKPDSQDICFVPNGKYAEFIENYTGRKAAPGNVTDTDGNIVGKHGGLINYTIGQRKGLGIAFGKPVYVTKKNVGENTLIVGTEQELFSTTLIADELNWISTKAITEPTVCKAKTRYRMKEQPCVIYPEVNGCVRVEFFEPQRAVTPGQRVVFYDGDIVIGGGTII